MTDRHLGRLKKLARTKALELSQLRAEITELKTREDIIRSRSYQRLLDKIAKLGARLHWIRLNITKKTGAYEARQRAAMQFKQALQRFKKQEEATIAQLIAAQNELEGIKGSKRGRQHSTLR